MATTLATARSSLSTTLAAAMTNANHYKRRQTNYQYPAVLVGWPQEYDASPDQGDERDFTVDVFVGVEVTDDDSSDDLLSSLLEAAVTALQSNTAWSVRPVTDFGEQATADERTIIWCRIPVDVFA